MMSTRRLDQVGNFISYALGGLGIVDDYDDILADIIEDDDNVHLHDFHDEVRAAVNFAIIRGVDFGVENDRLIAELEGTYEAECRVRGIEPRK